MQITPGHKMNFTLFRRGRVRVEHDFAGELESLREVQVNFIAERSTLKQKIIDLKRDHRLAQIRITHLETSNETIENDNVVLKDRIERAEHKLKDADARIKALENERMKAENKIQQIDNERTMFFIEKTFLSVEVSAEKEESKRLKEQLESSLAEVNRLEQKVNEKVNEEDSKRLTEQLESSLAEVNRLEQKVIEINTKAAADVNRLEKKVDEINARAAAELNTYLFRNTVAAGQMLALRNELSRKEMELREKKMELENWKLENSQTALDKEVFRLQGLLAFERMQNFDLNLRVATLESIKAREAKSIKEQEAKDTDEKPTLSEFLHCPISYNILDAPVILKGTGQYYSKASIQTYFATTGRDKNRDPWSRPIPNQDTLDDYNWAGITQVWAAIDKNLRCQITKEIFEDPVICMVNKGSVKYGFTYERSELEKLGLTKEQMLPNKPIKALSKPIKELTREEM